MNPTQARILFAAAVSMAVIAGPAGERAIAEPLIAPGQTGTSGTPSPPPGQRTADPALDEITLNIVRGSDLEAARGRLVLYLREQPESGRAELLMALTFHKQRRYTLARSHFERSLDLDAAEPLTHYYYGWCLFYLGEYEKSRRAFEAHLSMQPGEGDAHFAIGLLDLDADDLAAAEVRFRKAIELQQHNPAWRRHVAAAYTGLGDVAARREDHEKAREHYRQAVTLFPDLYGAHLRLSRTEARLGNEAAATEALEAFAAARDRVRPPRGFPEQ